MYIQRLFLLATGLLVASPALVLAQYGSPRGGMSGAPSFGRERYPVPALPGAELDGPPDTATMRTIASLSDSQIARYAQVYDSFMVATRPQRDSARVATDKMNARLDGGDRAAAQFYAELLQDLGKTLRGRQDKFDDRLKSLLSGDQLKAYKRWEEDAQRSTQQRNRAEAVRWQEPSGFAGGFGLGEERRTTVQTAGVVSPDLGAQAVRVGRTLYISAQTALDSSGSIVGKDLAAQAVQAFRNLTAVLKSASSTPGDIVRLTIYVVNYDPKDVTAIRSAGGAFFSGRDAPVATILGVQSLAQPGLLIAIEATAVTR
ncbi:MAG TPA: RidA family protein [Gemmatimonadales bacterium]|nr:RidA family protein [Gemmatimonadales bacterium]